MSWIFISDLHLDNPNSGLFEAFEHFLQREQNADLKGLYILGDLCDAWIGDDDDSELAERLSKLLLEFSEQIPVYFVHGNRDFLLGSAFAQSCGLTLLPDPSVVELAGTRIVLAHGDAYCTGDTKYIQMRLLSRSESFKADLLRRSLHDRRAMAASLRADSIKKNANKADNIMDVTPSEITRVLKEHDAWHLIHGHTHRPAIHREIIDRKNAFRYVLGDWLRCGWLLRFDGQRFQMECFALNVSQ